MKRIELVSDSFLIHDFIENNNSFDILKNEVQWGNFTINDKILSRTGCFQGIPTKIYGKNVYPWLRCPSIEHQHIYDYTPMVNKIKHMLPSYGLDNVNNIAKIQYYDNGDVIIHSHSDKILDLMEYQPIYIFRCGAERTVKLTHKITKKVLTFSMPNNSMFVLGWKTNLEYSHGVIENPEIKELDINPLFVQKNKVEAGDVRIIT